MNNWRQKRFAEAYREMWSKARYRPSAPSDGFGTIMIDDEQLEDERILADEASRYAEDFDKQDDTYEFKILGCTNGEYNRLIVYFLNAAQLCCGGTDTLPFIKKLAELSIKEIEEIEQFRLLNKIENAPTIG